MPRPTAVPVHVAAAVQASRNPAAGSRPRPPFNGRVAIQCYPAQSNKGTNKLFLFKDGKDPVQGRDAILAASTDGAHSGYIRYSYHDPSKTCILEHIENDPENGTGLGPVLMNLLARKAKAGGYTKMEVSMPRYPAYYTRWGFVMQGSAFGRATTQAILDSTAQYTRASWDEWQDARFGQIYVDDRRREASGLAPTLTSFPKIE